MSGFVREFWSKVLAEVAVILLAPVLSTGLWGLLASHFLAGGGSEIRPLEVYVSPTFNLALFPASADAPQPPASRPSPMEDVQCTDVNDHRGAFQAVVFLDAYHWARGSTDLVEFNDEIIPYFPTVLRQQPLQQLLSEALVVVAVGTASCESPLGFLVENRRAAQRAQQLVRWIEEARTHLPSRPGAPMRSVIPLNLGRYTKDCADSHAATTARQRRIVLIGVSEMAEGLDLESCLRRAMRNDPSLEFLTENYSKFELDAEWKVAAHP
jgi:hypothetical protein